MEKFEHEYKADQIQVLEGLEAVRKRPGMYIGSVSARGLHHLVYEIVDNSVDEALAGYCKNIHVTIEKGNVIKVEDDGRGIPVDIHPKTKISAAETVYTVLHAGGKFGGDSGYKVSGGLHGVGSSVVNALSTWTEVTIQRDGGIYQMAFERGKTVKPLQRIGDSDKTGTTVRFLADDTIFETLEYEYEILENRLREMAFLTKGLRITLTDEREETPKKADFCYEGGLVSFVEFLNKNKEKLNPKPIYIEKNGDTPVEIAIQYTTSYSENIYSFVNNINTIEGGTHLEGFKRSLTKVFNDYARSHNILKDKDGNLQGEDIREGITAVISVKVKEPQFEGQTKTKLGNSEVTGAVQSVMNEELSAFLEENPAVAKAVLEKCISASRAREAARKGKGARQERILSGKLAPAQTKNKKKRIIPINDVTFEILNRVIKKREKQLGKTYRGKGAISDQLVFVTVYGDAYCQSGFNSTLNYSINKTLKSGYEFECPRLSPHIFRHTFATRCIESGIAIEVLQKILGHADITTTINTYGYIYSYLRQKELNQKYTKYMQDTNTILEENFERFEEEYLKLK